MTFFTQADGEAFSIDPVAARDMGRELAAGYAEARPFPHTVIDDFLPHHIVERCRNAFEDLDDGRGDTFDRNQERGKRSINPDLMSPEMKSIFYTFNSRPFVRVIENITGIKGLIPDPYFLGGGFHEIGRGGHLSIHADFNLHKLMRLERRVNVLIYLNPDWKEEYGGQLELWDTKMRGAEKSVVPLENRCVIFSTTAKSFHGNPQPVSHPEGTTRKSIALYYYTATWDDDKVEKTTQFKPRRGTTDRIDWEVKSIEAAEEFLPPILARKAKRALRRLFFRRQNRFVSSESAGSSQPAR